MDILCAVQRVGPHPICLSRSFALFIPLSNGEGGQKVSNPPQEDGVRLNTLNNSYLFKPEVLN